MAAAGHDVEDELKTDYREIEAKSILVRSRLPDTDYVVNAYVGCEFACGYCYASFMGSIIPTA